jgi:hypothetical protein
MGKTFFEIKNKIRSLLGKAPERKTVVIEVELDVYLYIDHKGDQRMLEVPVLPHFDTDEVKIGNIDFVLVDFYPVSGYKWNYQSGQWDVLFENAG